MTRKPARDDAWLAGLFEGEGYISISGRSVMLAITSTDYDVLDAVLAVAQVGRIGPEYRHKGKGKEHWKPFKRWEVRGIADAQGVIKRLRPYLLARRGAKADELLAMTPILHDHRPGRRGGKDPDRLCRRGLHPMNGKRYCQPCAQQREREHLAEQGLTPYTARKARLERARQQAAITGQPVVVARQRGQNRHPSR